MCSGMHGVSHPAAMLLAALLGSRLFAPPCFICHCATTYIALALRPALCVAATFGRRCPFKPTGCCPPPPAPLVGASMVRAHSLLQLFLSDSSRASWAAGPFCSALHACMLTSHSLACFAAWRTCPLSDLTPRTLGHHHAHVHVRLPVVATGCVCHRTRVCMRMYFQSTPPSCGTPWVRPRVFSFLWCVG